VANDNPPHTAACRQPNPPPPAKINRCPLPSIADKTNCRLLPTRSSDTRDHKIHHRPLLPPKQTATCCRNNHLTPVANKIHRRLPPPMESTAACGRQQSTAAHILSGCLTLLWFC